MIFFINLIYCVNSELIVFTWLNLKVKRSLQSGDVCILYSVHSFKNYLLLFSFIYCIIIVSNLIKKNFIIIIPTSYIIIINHYSSPLLHYNYKECWRPTEVMS